jgi:ComF family protein
MRAILHAFKFDGRQSLAAPLGALLRDAGREVLAGADGVVPIPLHWTRRLARGFNQAELLARHLGVPLLHPIRRTRPTRAQHRLSAAARHANLRHAFAPRAGASLIDRVVVLVDDVRTTGATLASAAEVVRRLGAREVRALTVALVASGRPAPPPPPRPPATASRRS